MPKFDRNDPNIANQLREQSERRADTDRYDSNGFAKVDSNGVPEVDIFGKDHGHKIEAIRNKVLAKRNR